MKKKKEETIKIDKDFLDLILKKITDLEKKFELIEKSPPIFPTSIPKVVKKDKGHFWCGEMRIRPIKNAAEFLESQAETKELHKELEQLMRKYKVINLTASIFSSLEK